jgi:hypothetical protein
MVVIDPMIVEALSPWGSVIFAKLQGFSRVVMEVDCLQVVNIHDSRVIWRSIVAPVLLQNEGLVSTFNFFSTCKASFTWEETFGWMDLAPSFPKSSLEADYVGAMFPK